MGEQHTTFLLSVALDSAVPFWRDIVSKYRQDTMLARARAAGEVLSCFGDLLMFRRQPKRAKQPAARNLIDFWLAGDHFPRPPPTTAEVFNATAEGIACALCVDAPDDIKQMHMDSFRRLFAVRDGTN